MESPGGDGIKYWAYANNLYNGYYAEDISNPMFLWSGPGWPLFLSLFKFSGVPIAIGFIINALFVYFSSLVLFQILLRFSSHWILSLLACYFMFLSIPDGIVYSFKLYTEPVTVLAILLLTRNLIFKKNTLKYVVINGILVAYIILTKVFFFYTILPILALSLFLFFLTKKNFHLYLFRITVLSLVLISPYLVYTYSLTGQHLYFANSGGDLLYYTSSPYPSELGQWREGERELTHKGGNNAIYKTIRNKYNFYDSELLMQIDSILLEKRIENHKKLVDLFEGKNGLEMDLIYKELALENIKNHPDIFAHNVFFNLSRLLTGQPFYLYFKPPYTPIFKTLLIIKSCFFLILILASLMIHVINFKLKDIGVNYALLFILLYLGGISLLANQSQRFLIPIMPVLIIYIFYILKKHVNIEFK